MHSPEHALKLAFLVRSLEVGGAERQLVVLAKGLRSRGHQVSVAVFYRKGPFVRELEESGIAVHDLRKGGRWDALGFLARLIALLRRERPEVLYTFLTASNILTVPIRPFLPPMRYIWSIRFSYVDLARYDWLARLTYRLERRWAGRAHRIVVNSRAGLRLMAEAGFPRERMTVVQNGLDTERFRPDEAAGRGVGAGWGTAPGTPLIGIVGRLDVMKDHPTFLRAAALLAERRPQARFVVVGDGPAEERERLAALAGALGLGERLVWAGARQDMPEVYNALHLHTSASYGEGFPNVVAEAMACGVPNVVTDVGDSALLVDDTGAVVPPRDPAALAGAWERLLTLPAADFAALKARARRRMVEHFSIARMLDDTEAVLRAKLPGAPA